MSEMTDHDWLQIEQAANGCYSGPLEDWPDLIVALEKCRAINRLGSCTASVINLCQALWWSRKANLLEDKLDELENPCVWSYDEVHGKWDGACGIGWYFFESDETPTGHGMNYCPRCQHPITEEPTEGSE